MEIIIVFILEKRKHVYKKMADHAVPYTQLNYFSLKGLCNKRCLGGRYHSHRNRESLKLCKNNCGNCIKI